MTRSSLLLCALLVSSLAVLHLAHAEKPEQEPPANAHGGNPNANPNAAANGGNPNPNSLKEKSNFGDCGGAKTCLGVEKLERLLKKTGLDTHKSVDELAQQLDQDDDLVSYCCLSPEPGIQHRLFKPRMERKAAAAGGCCYRHYTNRPHHPASGSLCSPSTTISSADACRALTWRTRCWFTPARAQQWQLHCASRSSRLHRLVRTAWQQEATASCTHMQAASMHMLTLHNLPTATTTTVARCSRGMLLSLPTLRLQVAIR